MVSRPSDLQGDPTQSEACYRKVLGNVTELAPEIGQARIDHEVREVRRLAEATTADGRAEVELTIQLGAEEDGDLLPLLTTARARAKALLSKPETPERVQEAQFCSGAYRVTLRRPRLPLAKKE